MQSKLVWNSPLDAEETFEVKMAELKATLIKESVYHCVYESESNKRLVVRPPHSQEGQPSYATRYTAWEKSLKDLSDDAFLCVLIAPESPAADSSAASPSHLEEEFSSAEAALLSEAPPALWYLFRVTIAAITSFGTSFTYGKKKV